MEHRTKTIATLVILLGVLVLFLAVFVVDIYLPRQHAAMSSGPKLGVLPSAAVLEQLKESKGVQALVIYTDSGFESAITTIKTGQAIRFTNDASGDVWIGQITNTNMPSNPKTSECDSPIEVCHVLHPGDFIELTFPDKGTFSYMNDLNPTMRGTVVVQ